MSFQWQIRIAPNNGYESNKNQAIVLKKNSENIQSI